MIRHIALIAILLLMKSAGLADETRTLRADLLVVGGTESGCAAAVQAARMGIRNIVLVNDIEWLGGQFSAEGLGAIDENRGHGYDGTVPIPRSGIFRDVIDAIEQKNAEMYGGVRRPGNTRVITTARPVVAEAVFRELLAPFEEQDILQRFSDYSVARVLKSGSQVTGVEFTSPSQPPLRVVAQLTIDASDWGDVIKLAEAEWDAGADLKSEFDEPSAPESLDVPNDMNPITWCMILERQQNDLLFPRPRGYAAEYFNGQWGWINEEFAYTSRRLVDGAGFEQITQPDVLLINSPPTDYPLDVYPADVAAALEATEVGASEKNIVAMSPLQREIVFNDARRHSLKYFYHLQQRFPKFHSMTLSDEFGTPDRLPPKPYIRESLRLVAQYIVREQEVAGFGSRSNYATAMFPDAVFSWQFELDFHPTKRAWTTDRRADGPWEATFRGNRRFGRGGTGRCVFPLRSLVPKSVGGLLGAQKNLGYTSIVGSSCRLHDQSVHVGQAAGAVAAVSLQSQMPTHAMAMSHRAMSEIWSGLLEPEEGAPLVIWPFADVDPFDRDFASIQYLALRRLLPMGPADTAFRPDELATPDWKSELFEKLTAAGYDMKPQDLSNSEERRTVAATVWNQIRSQSIDLFTRQSPEDADADGIPDDLDALPFTSGEVSWQLEKSRDGVPVDVMGDADDTQAFNFTSVKQPPVDQFRNDTGAEWNSQTGFGWQRDLRKNTRLRGASSSAVADGFVFTRSRDVWECQVRNGQWRVQVCVGDSGHPQPGQHVSIEGQSVISDVETAAGVFFEASATVDVVDGRLTVAIGRAESDSNTCLNWLVLTPVSEAK